MNAILRAVGHRVKSLRALRGLSQEQLGRAAGLSRQAITFIERGRASTGVDNIYAIAAALECVPADLLPAPSVIEAENKEIARLAAERRTALKARLDERIAALQAQRAEFDKASTPPIYDDVFYSGLAALDALDGDVDTEGGAG